jgi:ketosteroid isomerase-like protein
MGVYETVIQVSSEKQMTDKGKYLEIWKKQPDGSWKIILESFSSDRPH